MENDYTRPLYETERNPDPQPDPRLLWTGGMATAAVAALVALVGVVIIRGIFHIPVIGPSEYGTFGDVSTVWLCMWSAVAAIAATGLMHVLLLTTPRPHAFFGWIVGLVTVVFALHPFTMQVEVPTQLATGVIYIILGIAIGTLLSGVASAALRRS